MRRAGVFVLGLATIIVARASAQQDICVPRANSHEANTFAILSLPFAFTAAIAPGSSTTSIGLELASLPPVSRIDATPTACRPGKGPENTDPVPAIVRPRLATSWHGLQLEISWIPPLRIDQVEADLLSLAVGGAWATGHGWTAGVRAFAVLGSLRARVTCDDAARRDPTSDCFGGTRSDDRWQPGLFGAEAAVANRRSRRWQPYIGAGYTVLRPRFEVDFTNAEDSTDHRRVDVNLTRIAAFAGVTLQLGRSTITAEAYATPADAWTARVVARVSLSRHQ